jgi:hypothetical protein
MTERPDEHDLVAVLGDGVEDGEVPVGDAPAHARDLRGQLVCRGVARCIVRLEQ